MRVVLHASHLVVYDRNVELARHERLIPKGGLRLDLDHYLEALIPGATALEQARSAGKFTPVHDAWWAQARKVHGERDGTRALIEVLLLNRHLAHEHVVAGLATALRAGALTADAVAPAAAAIMRRSPVTLPRQRGLTEQAADAAIDTACRLLRLPSIRNEIADRAIKDQMTYRGFLAELLMTECDDRARRRSERRIKAAGIPREKPCGPSTSMPTPTSTPPPSIPSQAANGSRRASRSA